MIKFPKKRKEISSDLLVRTIWISTILAMVFSIPPITVFLGVYYGVGNLILGAILGFGLHFVILIFSGKISRFLIKIVT